MLEDKGILSCLLRNKSGAFVAQACLDSGAMQPRTSTFIVNYLLGQASLSSPTLFNLKQMPKSRKDLY
jgi:hypothetical protein